MEGNIFSIRTKEIAASVMPTKRTDQKAAVTIASAPLFKGAISRMPADCRRNTMNGVKIAIRYKQDCSIPIIDAPTPEVSGASRLKPTKDSVPNRPGISKTNVMKLLTTYAAPLNALARAK